MQEGMMSRMTTIIVPVYNGYEHLQRLVRSLFANTVGDFVYIFIDDASTDQCIKSLLEEIENKPGVSVIYNENNMGFPATVNKAVALCSGHFILLNSDTEVPYNWAKRIMQFIGDGVASVSPFSNAATLGSFPVPFEDNRQLIDDFPVQEIDDAVKMTTVPTRPGKWDVFTGVGFCWAVNRDAWNQCGGFDVKTFGRGYGEEVDWCCRTRAAGWRHILLPNLFVAHYHGGSFASEEKQQLCAQHQEILDIRYPSLQASLRRYKITDPFFRYRLQAAIRLGLPLWSILNTSILFTASWRKLIHYGVRMWRLLRGLGLLAVKVRSFDDARILVRKVRDVYTTYGIRGAIKRIVHRNTQVPADLLSFKSICAARAADCRQFKQALEGGFTQEAGAVLMFDHMYGGGAMEFSGRMVKEKVAQGVPVLRLVYDNLWHRIQAFAHVGTQKYTFYIHDISDLVVQDVMKFSKIIINELVFWGGNGQNVFPTLQEVIANILLLQEKYSASVEIYAHDFYPVCPSYTLVDNTGQFCRLSKSQDYCDKCLSLRDDYFKKYSIKDWRELWFHIISKAVKIHFFSNASRQLFETVFSLRPEQVEVKGHAPLFTLPEFPVVQQGAMRILVLGALSPEKGAYIIHNLAALLATDEQIIVLGELCDRKNLPGNVIIHGRYTHDNLFELLQRYKPNIALMPSIWPETFSYVTQEIMQLNIPLVAFDLGAQGERVGQWVHGQLAKECTAQSAYAALQELFARKQGKNKHVSN